MVFSAFPRSGPPPRFRDYEDYAAVVGQLERTGCIADYTHIWWDIRLHPRLGTIEIRICDAVTERRGRRRDRGVLPGARQAALRAARGGRGDPVVPPDPHEREQVARRTVRARGADHGSRDRGAETAQPVARLIRRTVERAAATRARPRLRARARGHPPRSSRAARRRIGSCASSTRSATSPRSRARSRTRPRRSPPAPGRRSRRNRLAQFPQNGRTSIVPICATG